jgi:O-antigen/teichoic acid export membrane protein
MISVRTFGSAVRWNLIGSMARVVLTLVCQLTLLRLLGPVVAGHFAIFLTIVGVGTVLSEGGMMAALTRAPELDDKAIRNALFIVLCYASVVAAVLLTCSAALMNVFHLTADERYIPLVAVLNVIPLGLSSVPLSMLRRQYRSRELQIIQVSAYALGFAMVAVPLSFFRHSAVVMVTAFTIQTFVTLIGAIWVARCPIVPRISGASAIQSASWRALTSNIAFYLSESAAGFLTAHMIGARAVGIYGTALNLLRMPTDVIIATLQAPLLVSAAQDHGGSATRARFLTTLHILASTVFAVFVTVYLMGNQLVIPFLGARWADAGPALSVAGLIMVVRILSMLSGAVMWGRGRLLTDTAAQTVALAIVVLAFLFFRPAEAATVAWIVLASVAVRMLIQLTVTVRACEITLSMLWRELLLPLLLTTVMMLPIAWIGPALMPRYGFIGVIAAAAAAGLLLLLRLVIGLWLTPNAWTRSLIDLVPLGGRRRATQG